MAVRATCGFADRFWPSYRSKTQFCGWIWKKENTFCLFRVDDVNHSDAIQTHFFATKAPRLPVTHAPMHPGTQERRYLGTRAPRYPGTQANRLALYEVQLSDAIQNLANLQNPVSKFPPKTTVGFHQQVIMRRAAKWPWTDHRHGQCMRNGGKGWKKVNIEFWIDWYPGDSQFTSHLIGRTVGRLGIGRVKG